MIQETKIASLYVNIYLTRKWNWIGCNFWTTLHSSDNWDRVFLFVMNSKWLITWEGGTLSGESLRMGVKNVTFNRYMFKVPPEYCSAHHLCSSSSIVAADHFFVNCSIICIQSEMRTWHRFPRTSGAGNRYWRWKLETSKNVNIYNWSHTAIHSSLYIWLLTRLGLSLWRGHRRQDFI